jgi:hypothetical protein
VIEQFKEFAKAYPPILSFLLTTIGSVAYHYLKPKVKLIWGIKSEFTHVMRPKGEGQQAVLVHTATFTIQNNGRLPATDIEIVLNYEPDEVSIWPQRQYAIVKNNETRQILVVKFLGARESIDLSMICVGRDLPVLLNVKSPEATGTRVPITYNRLYPRWVLLGLWGLIFLGVVFVLEKAIPYFL